ncbi:hypothetical protein [Steroidobacter sp.]|uniref:hypothetical protein n=1 Tax=Steroidobacter sp. TaxID=1978227 RepID=UPI001A4295BC|nr:hypothetical protein [Steroidobacter sp.]MBL8265496.1 hypothetical protein [Steroidobacter sp.]
MKRRSKRKWQLVVAVLVLLAGIGVWSGRDTFATARIGTTYLAKQTCSCLFVAERPFESCRADFDPEAVRSLDVVASSGAVTASALGGLISSRAVFETGYGCHPVN